MSRFRIRVARGRALRQPRRRGQAGGVKTVDFDYDLPEELIAQTAAEPRDASRLMVVLPDGTLEHRRFGEIGEYLRPGDALVLNDTRVVQARLRGRFAGGGAVEALLLRHLDDGDWEAMVRPGRRFRAGRALIFGELAGTVEESAVQGIA